MDGIGLELWNKKLVLCRYKRQVAFKACLDGSRIKGSFHNPVLLSDLFQIAADNLDVLILYWKEIFLSSWQRQKPENPAAEAEKAITEVQAFLATEEKQIEGEIFSLGNEQGLKLKMEDLKEGRGVMDREVSVFKTSCIALVSDMKTEREEQLVIRARESRRRQLERWLLPTLTGLFVAFGSIGGVWVGDRMRVKRSTEDREFIDRKLQVQAANQRQISEELSALHRSNRKIAFWTEKTADQIDQEMSDARAKLGKEIADIREDSARKVGLIESEYARSGRDGGVDLERRKQALSQLRDRQIQDAQDRVARRLNDLSEQKEHIQQ